MSTKPGNPEHDHLDNLSRLQKRMEELGVMFYTYLGIIQRDAPPVTRGPEEADEMQNDTVSRAELVAKLPGFAKEIVQCSRDVDTLVDGIEEQMTEIEGKERELLDAANFESAQIGEEMSEAVDDAHKLLESVRQITSARETET